MQKITFITNVGKNTLDHLKLLIKSLKENLTYKGHEIIIFIDSDNEGIKDYLINEKKNFFDLKIITHKLNPIVGYQRNSNLLVELAKNEIVSYLQSDMIVSKNYDLEILKDIEENCILSSTRIEPPLHGKSPMVYNMDFGVDPNFFKWDEFISYAETVKNDKIIDYFFAPFTFYKKTWLKTEGYDTLFRRSREDSDFVQRCLHLGIKLKQTFRANVYHFSCVSSRGKNWFDSNNKSAIEKVELQKIADNIELKKFLRKWGGFNHGDFKLEKLDIDLVIYGNILGNENFIQFVEPFFSRIWLGTRDERDSILKLYENENEAANKLLSFTEEDWNNSRKYYNTTNYELIYNLGDVNDFSIKFILNLNKMTQNDEILKNLQNLTNILREYEVGKYEYGAWQIEIRKFNSISEKNLKNINPPFELSLLEIL